jgi:hypothetical protein
LIPSYVSVQSAERSEDTWDQSISWGIPRLSRSSVVKTRSSMSSPLPTSLVYGSHHLLLFRSPTPSANSIRVYIAALEFDKDDKPSKEGTSKRSFCSNCSSMLWNYHDEYPDWIYPFASTIDTPNPLPSPPKGAEMISIKRDCCPSHVPLPEGVKGYDGYGPMEGIEVSDGPNLGGG